MIPDFVELARLRDAWRRDCGAAVMRSCGSSISWQYARPGARVVQLHGSSAPAWRHELHYIDTPDDLCKQQRSTQRRLISEVRVDHGRRV